MEKYFEDEMHFNLEFAGNTTEINNDFLLDLLKSNYIVLGKVFGVSPLLNLDGYISGSLKNEFLEYLKSKTDEDISIIIYFDSENIKYQFYDGCLLSKVEGSIFEGWTEPKYICDENGEPIEVIISIDEYDYHEKLEENFIYIKDKLEKTQKAFLELKIALVSNSLNQTN